MRDRHTTFYAILLLVSFTSLTSLRLLLYHENNTCDNIIVFKNIKSHGHAFS